MYVRPYLTHPGTLAGIHSCTILFCPGTSPRSNTAPTRTRLSPFRSSFPHIHRHMYTCVTSRGLCRCHRSGKAGQHEHLCETRPRRTTPYVCHTPPRSSPHRTYTGTDWPSGRTSRCSDTGRSDTSSQNSGTERSIFYRNFGRIFFFQFL